MPVLSPCIRRCCLDDDDVCVGCFRTLNEITAWSSMSEDEKARCVARSAERKARAPVLPWLQPPPRPDTD